MDHLSNSKLDGQEKLNAGGVKNQKGQFKIKDPSGLIEAVALKYSPGNDEFPGDLAPVITAKEKGVLARRMIELAEENDVPVVEDEFLANVLSLQQIGDCIPEETWQAVAGIFAYIQTLENKNG